MKIRDTFLSLWIKGPYIFFKDFILFMDITCSSDFPYSFQNVKIRQTACLLLQAPASLSTEIFKVISILCPFSLHFNRDRKIFI